MSATPSPGCGCPAKARLLVVCSAQLVSQRLAAAGLPVVLDVAPEGARRGELAQLVPHHGLGDEHRDVLTTVVYGDRVPQHVRNDRGPSGPGLDDRLLVGLVQHVHLFEQVVVDEWALLQTTRHSLSLPSCSALLTGATTPNDELVAGLAAAGASLRLAGRVHRVPATGGLALATTVRVVDRVHGHTTDGRALALPPHPARLAPVDVRVLRVADLADGGPAAHVHVADLAGRHAQLRERTVLGDELHARTGRAGDLGAATGPELAGAHPGAGGDVAQRQVVARLDVRGRTRLHLVALAQLGRRDDGALLAVHVVQQRDAGGAVGVVLDVRDLGRDAVLVRPAEVDQPVGTLVTATLVARGDLAVRVAATVAVQRAQQRLLRRRPGDLGEVGDAGATTARRRRLVLADAHCDSRPLRGGAAEDLDRLALGGQGHDGSFGVLALPVAVAGALALALAVERVDAHDLDTEDLLDRDLDGGLVGPGVHQERVLALFEQAVGLLGNHRCDQDVAGVGDHSSASSTSDSMLVPASGTSVELATALPERPRAGPARS